eukprot:TCONS_00023328-protein
MLGLLKRGFQDPSPHIFQTLYTTFVRPHLEYAQSVWQPRLRRSINLIESVQRRATKLVKPISQLPYAERLRRLVLPSLEFRRLFCDMVQVYKHIHIYDSKTTPKKFIKRMRPCRKHIHELQMNFPDDGVRGAQSKSFFYRISTWNALPKYV